MTDKYGTGSFDDFQIQSKQTAVYRNQGNNYIYPTLGLVSEAGEVAGCVKRIDRDDSGVLTNERREEIGGEIGDVLWYAAQLATELGLSLSVIAEANLAKLQGRKGRETLRGHGER